MPKVTVPAEHVYPRFDSLLPFKRLHPDQKRPAAQLLRRRNHTYHGHLLQGA